MGGRASSVIGRTGLRRDWPRRGGAARIVPAVLGIALVAALTCGTFVFLGGFSERRPADSDPVFGERPELGLGRSADYDYDPPAPGSYQLPVIKPAGDGSVVGTDGQSLRFRDVLEGRITVLSFIYTRCADPSACPYATGVLYDLHRVSQQDPLIAESLRLITFSFDPEHDTPRVMSDYGNALRHGAGSEWLFLTTRDRTDLEPILRAYGQQITPKKNPDDPLGPYSHMLRVYLVDRRGTVRNIYSTGLLDPRLVVTDVRTLLLEEQAAKERAR